MRALPWLLMGWLWVLTPVAAAPSELELSGAFVQGGLVAGQTLPGSRVEQDGLSLRVSEQGRFLIGFGRDAAATSRLSILLPDGRRVERTLEVAPREYRIQRVDGLPPRKVTPSTKDLERIRREAALVRKARTRDDPRTDFLGGFVWPARGPITGIYGSQRILNGKPRRPHFGVDIAAPEGSPVVAPADGVVTLAYPDMFYSGGTLIVDHGFGLSSAFLHLKRILVKKGQTVKQGQPIAEVGATGRVTGAHLDWRVNLFRKRLDAQLLVGEM